MEYFNCPLCGKNETEIIFTKGNLDRELINVICKNCSLVYINPRPTKEEYDNFHKEEFLKQKSITETGQIAPKLKKSELTIKRTIFDFLKEYLRAGQKVLDIGCGYGTLLDIVKKETGADVYGLELGDLDVKAAKEFYGLDVFHGSLEEFAAKEENWGKFDIVAMHHVLEHLPRPLESLEQIKKLLKSGGLLYIGVPNIMNIKKRPDIFFQIAHPFSYSPYSLGEVLQSGGFSVIKFNRRAGYPGGMEAAAKLGGDIKLTLEEGADYKAVIKYVGATDKKFIFLRKIRKIVLFWLPNDLRTKISRPFYKFLKKI